MKKAIMIFSIVALSVLIVVLFWQISYMQYNISAYRNSQTPTETIATDKNKTEKKKKVDPTGISLAEFEAIELGMTIDEVVEIVGSKGEQTAQSGNVEFRTWHGETNKYAMAEIDFVNGKVYSKSQIGLE